jgi:hypothetical protein
MNPLLLLSAGRGEEEGRRREQAAEWPRGPQTRLQVSPGGFPLPDRLYVVIMLYGVL